MLIVFFKILVLLQPLKYTIPKETPLYLATYWKTTHVSDKVPDYWNHGAIYVPGLPEKKTEDIFPAWLRRSTTESSNQVTETTIIQDYIFDNNHYVITASSQIKDTTSVDNDDKQALKNSADKTSSINNRYITTSSRQMTETTHLEDYDIEVLKTTTDKVSNINSQHTTTSSQITDATTVEDYDIEVFKTSFDKRTSFNNRYTITPSGQVTEATSVENDDIEVFKQVFKTKIDKRPGSISLMPQKELSNTENIIAWTSFPIVSPTSAKNYFTRPEFETTIDDYEPRSTSITTNPSIITIKKDLNPDFISIDNIFHDFTRPERETTIDNNDASAISTTMQSVTTSLEESKPMYIITDSIFPTTAPKPSIKYITLPGYQTSSGNDGAHLISTIMTAPSTTDIYETTYDFASHPNSTRIALQTSTLEYDTIMNEDDVPIYTTVKQHSEPSYEFTFDVTAHASTIENAPELTTTLQITPSKADPEPIIRAVNREMTTDPFSVFLRKLLIVLSVKRLEDLPLLVDHFKEYLWMLLTSGQLGKLGLYINSYLAKRVLIIDKLPIDDIRKYLNKFQKMLANRYKEISKDVNDILDYMDDTYDESEEEAMQAVLYEASLFPNTRNTNKIAQGFVDYVFLNPMKRVIGTTRGNVLFGMISEAVKKRDHLENNRYKVLPDKDLRRKMYTRKTPKHLRKALYTRSNEVPTHNKLHKKKGAVSEDNCDSRSSSKISGENTKKTKSSHDANDYSDDTESTIETKESKYYTYKNYGNILARNYKHHRTVASVNQVTTRSRELRKSLNKLRTFKYAMKTKQQMLNNNKVQIQRNSFSRKNSRTATSDSADLRETDSNNFEMELKAKIYDVFRSMNAVNYTASRRMRQSIRSTVNVQDDSQETDVERVLKKNIYKAVKKLLN